MKKVLLLGGISSLLMLSSCDLLDDVSNAINTTGLTETEMVSGLKEALVLGSKTAAFTLSDTTGTTNALGEVTGYFTNELVKIALPADAENAFTIISKLNSVPGAATLLGVAGIDLSGYRDAIIKGLNRGAETAAGLSADVFKDAVTQMTFTSAKTILFGTDSLGATNYLETTTSATLTTGFTPIISSAFSAVKISAFGTDYSVTGVWSEFSVNYNKVAAAYQTLVSNASSANPVTSSVAQVSLATLSSAGVTSIDPLETNIVTYATGKALDGLFLMVGKQELKIRRDPVAALTAAGSFITQTISDLIKKVFTASE